MLADLKILFEADKQFSAPVSWKVRDDNWMLLVSPLDINGVTIEGLKFRGTARRDRPDEQVTFQLEYFPTNGKYKGGPFSRIDWNPMRPHTNKMIGPVEHQNILQFGSHNHEFRLNWEHNERHVRGGVLPISTPISPDFNYNEIVAFVGKEFRISNIHWLPIPEWSETLF